MTTKSTNAHSRTKQKRPEQAAGAAPATSDQTSKLDRLVGLLRRSEGAGIAELSAGH